MISAHHLHKSYGSLHVLNDISLHIAPAEVVSIVGASGAGKTTLLQLLGTLDRPDSGEVIISGTDVTRLSDKALSRFRNEHIGFVFQFHNLLPEFTAIENICLPALIRGVPLAQAQDDARRLLESLNLADRANHKPAALSGGEQQRVAVARALINKPSVILADEPSGNLDSAHARDLHNLFFLLREQYHQTFIIVTHNEELALMADRKIILKDGKNIQV
ncbi:MAG: ABC transporter ATP-binding protein [Bacteroidales bacterium]|nr:ABC transporter ATP-binding protein [Bacteroidales bacterium]